MARQARLVVPGYPLHITRRCVWSIDIFTDDADRHNGRCSMTDHVHLIAVPGEFSPRSA